MPKEKTFIVERTLTLCWHTLFVGSYAIRMWDVKGNTSNCFCQQIVDWINEVFKRSKSRLKHKVDPRAYTKKEYCREGNSLNQWAERCEGSGSDRAVYLTMSSEQNLSLFHINIKLFEFVWDTFVCNRCLYQCQLFENKFRVSLNLFYS